MQNYKKSPINTLLDKDSVDENKCERDDEEDVGEVEDELGHMVLRAVSLHIPVSDANLERYFLNRQNMSNIEKLSTDHVQWSTVIVLHVLVVKTLTLAVHQALKYI